MKLPPLGLYIHLPWCERKCPYCDFNSHEADTLAEAEYIDALLRDLRGDVTLAQGRPLATVFIGGGTPSLFSAGAIARLLRGIGALLEFAPGLEATMEANPGSAEAEKFQGFRSAGINRLSLGVQSFNDDCLRALGRVHNSEQALRAIEYAQVAAFDSINIDLMHGLPGQTTDTALSDLQTGIAQSPQHLSWYQLTIEPNTAFNKRPPVLPAENILADISARGESLLAASGYRQYEVSAYSQTGANCRHNTNYWTFGDYLAIGAGAHGKITFRDGQIERYWKTRQPSAYLMAEAGQHTCGHRLLAGTEIAGEFMLNALRLNDGFTLTLLRNRTGLGAADLQPQLDRLIARDLLTIQGQHIRATALGRRFLDSVVGEFFEDQP